MFQREVGEREVTFSWSPLPVTQHRGYLTNYTLSCSPSPSSLPQSPSQSGPLTVTGFSPDTYSCGSGPPSTTTFTTLPDCMYMHCKKGGVPSTPIVVHTYGVHAHHTSSGVPSTPRLWCASTPVFYAHY